MPGYAGIATFVANTVSWRVAACDTICFGFAVLDVCVACVTDGACFDAGAGATHASLALSCTSAVAGKVQTQKVFFTRIIIGFGGTCAVRTTEDLAEDRGVTEACCTVSVFLAKAVTANAGDLEALSAACANTVVAGLWKADIATCTKGKTLSALGALSIVAGGSGGAGESRVGGGAGSTKLQAGFVAILQFEAVVAGSTGFFVCTDIEILSASGDAAVSTFAALCGGAIVVFGASAESFFRDTLTAQCI